MKEYAEKFRIKKFNNPNTAFSTHQNPIAAQSEGFDGDLVDQTPLHNLQNLNPIPENYGSDISMMSVSMVNKFATIKSAKTPFNHSGDAQTQNERNPLPQGSDVHMITASRISPQSL